MGNLRLALPQVAKVALSSGSAPTQKTVTAAYSCDFSKYGTGISPVNMTVTFAYASSWAVNQPMTFGFTTDSITLPSQVSSQLTGVGSMTVASTITTKNATESTIALSAPTSATLPNPPTTIPQTDVFGQVTFPAKGTGALELPAQAITVTPMAGNAAQPAITCTTQTAATDEQIPVAAASGPFYNCVTSFPSGGTGSTLTGSGLTAMTVTASGTSQVGKSVTVKLISDDVAATIVAVAATLDQLTGLTVTKATFTSALPVQGPQPGTLHPSATVTDLTATSFSASEALALTKTGTTTVDIPATWSLDFFVGTTNATDIACKLVTSPAPVGLTLDVAAASGSAGSGSGEGTATSGTGGTTEGSGTPAGAPATGGGSAPGADLPMALGGLTVLLGGGWLVFRGVARGRRRA
jgi:hypothetical protein